MTTDNLLQTAKKVLQHYPCMRYWVGYSGGRDSHVLLDALTRLRDSGEIGADIGAIHINHQFHADALAWVKHCQNICDAYSVPLTVETVQTQPEQGQSIEAFARQARYQLIAKHLGSGEIFLSGHHQRDQAETFLLQLLRGAGLDGLRAMPVERPLGQGRYVRPLLSVEYPAIVAYAKARGLSFIEDSSNDDTRFDRNFLRHRLFPVLKTRFPQAEASIAQSANWLAEIPDPKIPDSLAIDDLLSVPAAEQKQKIRAFVKAKMGCSLSQTQTHYILQHHLTAAADKHPVIAVGDYCIRRFLGELYITEKLPESPDFPASVKVGQDVAIDPIVALRWQPGHGIVCDASELALKPLQGSARFHPHTRNKATTVKKALSEAQIPVWLRPYYRGLYRDESLLAIPGVGVAKAHYQKSADAAFPLWIIADKFVRM